MPNLLTPDEARVINIALAERDNYWMQVINMDSTIGELRKKDSDCWTARIAYSREAANYKKALDETREQNKLLKDGLDKAKRITKLQHRKDIKSMIGWGVGGLCIGVAIPTIILLVK